MVLSPTTMVLTNDPEGVADDENFLLFQRRPQQFVQDPQQDAIVTRASPLLYALSPTQMK